MVVSINRFENWVEKHFWAAVFGLLTPWLVFAVVSEMDNAVRPDDTNGMAFVALAMFLLVLGLRIRKRGENTRQITSEKKGCGEIAPIYVSYSWQEYQFFRLPKRVIFAVIFKSVISLKMEIGFKI